GVLVLFVVRRVAAMVPLMLLCSFGVFLLLSLAPGDPALALAGTPEVTPEQLALIRERYHLDRPLLVQYGFWLRDVVGLDLGVSRRTGIDVVDELRRRWPVTAGL